MGGHPVLENVRLFSVLPFPPFYLDDSNQSRSELEENLQVIQLWSDTYMTLVPWPPVDITNQFLCVRSSQ